MLFSMSYHIFTAFCTENGTEDDLVDEKGTHEHIIDFASKADIVVCCLVMNAETVRPLCVA